MVVLLVRFGRAARLEPLACPTTTQYARLHRVGFRQASRRNVGTCHESSGSRVSFECASPSIARRVAVDCAAGRLERTKGRQRPRNGTRRGLICRFRSLQATEFGGIRDPGRQIEVRFRPFCSPQATALPRGPSAAGPVRRPRSRRELVLPAVLGNVARATHETGALGKAPVSQVAGRKRRRVTPRGWPSA